MHARERLREAVRLAVHDEVDAPLPVKDHVLRAMARDRGEAELLEELAQQLRIGCGVFDEFESVGPHRVVWGGFLPGVVHGVLGIEREFYARLDTVPRGSIR